MILARNVQKEIYYERGDNAWHKERLLCQRDVIITTILPSCGHAVMTTLRLNYFVFLSAS